MEENINPLTGLPFNDSGISNPIQDPRNINPMTGQPMNTDVPIGISGSTLTPKIHEQIRLLNKDASYLRQNPNVDLAVAQGRGEEVGRAVKGFGKNILAGFSDALGVTVDPSIGMNILGGVDEHFDEVSTNFFTRFAESMRDQEGSEIYLKEGQNSFNPADSGWWSEMFAQSGTSVGIMLEALAETALVTYATAGLGTATRIPSILSKGKLLTKADKMKKNALLWAGLRRYSESLIEAKDNGLQTYNDYLRNGKTESEASQAASKVSQNTFMGNMPLLAFDLLTASALTSYNPVSGSSKLKNIFNLTKNQTVNKGIQIGTGALSEGSEEFWQELVNEEARYRVDVENGLVKPNDTRFNEYAKSGKAWNAFTSGIFGAGVLGGISKGLEKISDKESNYLSNRSQKEFIENNIGQSIETIKEIESLENIGDIPKANLLRRKLGAEKALTSIHLDALTNKENGYETYLEYLEDMSNMSDQELTDLGIEDPTLIKKNFPILIKDAQDIKRIYDEEKNYNSKEFLPKVVDTRFSLNVLSQAKSDIKSRLSEFDTTNPEVKSLSISGKRYLDLTNESNAIDKEIKKIKSEGFYTGQTKSDLLESLNEKKQSVKAEMSELQDVTQEDKNIVKSLTNNMREDLMAELNSINSAETYLRDKLNTLKDNKVQERAKESKVSDIVSNSKSSEELKEVKKDLDDKVSVVKKEEINDKIEQAEVEELSPDEEDRSVVENPPFNEERKAIGQKFEQSIIKPKAQVVEEDQLFEPLEIQNMDESQKEDLKNSVKDYVESLKTDLNKQPSFEDFIRDYIEHSNKENADTLFNVLKEGWKENNYPTTDFDQVYNKVFRDRKQLSKFITTLGSEITKQPELESSNNKMMKDALKKESVIVGIDRNNRPILKDLNPFKASDPDLRAAYLSIKYNTSQNVNEKGEIELLNEDASNSLNNSIIINSTKLLNPDKFNSGEKLTVRIPDNYRDIRIQTWEDAVTKGPVLYFRDWMENNNVEIGSDDWYSKVPMVAYDQENDPVFFIHDLEWYNYVNVGLKDNPDQQEKVIKDARKNLIDFRKSLKDVNDSVEIEITQKRPGTWKTIPNNQPAITLNEANPETRIAIADSNSELYLEGKEPFENESRKIINEKVFTPGHTYELRKVNKDSYVALNVLRPKISSDVSESLKQAIRAYIFQYDTESRSVEFDKIQSIRDTMIKSANLDLYNKIDLEDYLNQYIYTLQRSFSSNDDIPKYVNSRKDIEDGTPFIVMQKGSIVFGVKNKELVNGKSYLYLNPNIIKSDYTDAKAAGMMKALNELDSIIPNMSVNVNKNKLSENSNTFLINKNGEVIENKPYIDYIKDNLRTNIKSFNIGDTDLPVYATIIQPVINFKKVGDQQKPEKKEVEKVVEGVKNEFSVINKSIQALKSLGVKESDESIKILRDKLGQDQLLEPEITQEFIDSIKVEGPFTVQQEFELVDFVFNEMSKEIGFTSKKNKQELLESIRLKYNSIMEPKKKANQDILNNLKELYRANPELNANLKIVIDKFETELGIFDTIQQNWKLVEDKAIEKLLKYTGIKEITDNSDEQIYREKNFNKTSLEENGKDTASYRLKRFFSGIENIKPDGEVKTGFLGIPTYVGFDTVYETIGQVLSSPYETPSDFNVMIKRLEDNIENQPWLSQVIEKLNNSSQQIKNEFVYNFHRHFLSMKFMMYAKGRDGKYTTKVYDTNSNEIGRVIRRQWESNLINSDLIFIEDGLYKISKTKAKILLDKYEKWNQEISSKSSRKNKQPVNISKREIDKWLSEFGIKLSDETLNELMTRPVEIITQDGRKKVNFNQMFTKGSNSSGVFGLLADYLENIISKDDTSFEETPENHPFNNLNNILKVIARIESKYSLYSTTNSFRDGTKSIYGFTPTKNATDTTYKLKFDQNFRDQLSDKSFNGNSYILNILNTNESFKDKFYVDHLGITAIKELGKKIFGDNSITSLSDSDHEYLKVGMFQDTEQGDINFKSNGINMRMSRMLFPTMSDKSQMLDLYTAVLDLNYKNFVSQSGVMVPNSDVIDFYYSQVVKPEVDRIYNHVMNVKESNIKGYDTAAQMFLFVPEINNIIDEDSGKRVLSLMINNPETYNKEWFETTVKTKVENILKDLLKNKVDKKIEQWKSNGFISNDLSNKLLNSKYLDRIQGSNEEKIQIAAYDYIINSQVNNANIYMLYAGDPALYSKNSIKSFFENGKPYLPKNDRVYSEITKEIIGTNIGKRFAALIAPGQKLANSDNDSYVQVFMDDYIDYSSNIEYLVNLFYSNEEGFNPSFIRSKLKELSNTNNEVLRQGIINEISATYPKVADYVELESTDAQEYTTVKEHVDVLYRQGRLDDSVYNSVNNKLKENKDLTSDEVNFIMQPIKPVYTGFVNDQVNGVMRYMYIKSSSFPLIPQLTKDTELDKLRVSLEQLQQKSGKNVRASYDTANKVGSINNPVKPFNKSGNFREMSLDDLEASSIVLPRDNFRIQQDVPIKESQRISLGTQMLKLLFGDGIDKLSGFKLQNSEFTGKELKEEFNNTFVKYIDLNKQQLFNEIGVDSNGRPIDIKVTMDRLYNLLESEAKKRGYPQQDIDALELVPRLDSTGKIINIEFSIPLWLSPNSNRYESLLNSIVVNRTANIKLPGKSLVAGSEAGFKTKTDLEGIGTNNIVFTKSWEGSLKAATDNNKTQVLLPSVYTDDKGNKIDLTSSKYSERDEEGLLRLKEDMIDEELLSLTSFRIPTSSHVSMSQIEIAGFLPPEVGDLIIVPRNLTKQKGLDFDVDKENVYKLWTTITEDGKIKVLSEDDRTKVVGNFKEALEKEISYEQEADKLLSAIFQDNPEFIEGLFTDNTRDLQNKLERLNQEFDKKLLENKIVSIHSSVLSNPDKEVQKKINKVLSMDFAKSQAQLIDSLSKTEDKYFSILDDTYQKEKMYLGASGKLGIGIYSNYVVFNSLVQQAEDNIQLKVKDEDNNINPLKIQIGDIVSDGTLGRIDTLGKSPRSLTEVFAERQNTATDNEKEQIMGRVNVNDITINVDSLLSALGFDKDILDNGTEVSIPYLLLSQPIIKDYVELIKKSKSSTSEFNKDYRQEAIRTLQSKYFVQEGFKPSTYRKNLTGQNLLDNLSNPKNGVQLSVLDLFVELDDYSKLIGDIQRRLNINNSGLGKSFFETIDKYTEVDNLKSYITFNSKGLILSNGEKLIGNYVRISDELTEEDKNNYLKEGYIEFNNNLIKPTTPVGSMVVNTVYSGYNLWKDYFPYDNEAISSNINDIISSTQSEDISSLKRVEMSEQVFKEMKKYFVSSDKLEVFSGNPQEKRAELFFDTKDNTSLSTYLKDNSSKYDILKSNTLINKFEYTTNKNGLPSLIKFDNTRQSNFDEEYLYKSIINLIVENESLPDFNGKPYSTGKLAQDLIAYSYLEGGVQEAIQFTRYIPISYLNNTEFGSILREWQYRPNLFSKILEDRFKHQYIQHNPEKLFKIKEEEISQKSYVGNSSKLEDLESFVIDGDGIDFQYPEYVSIYNRNIKKGLNKLQIYKKEGFDYKRINNLGVFGLSEYSIRDNNVQSLIYNNRKVSNIPPVKREVKENNDVLNISSGNIQEIINNISNHKNQKYPFINDLSKVLSEYIPQDLKVNIEDILDSSGNRIGRGRYKDNTITIDKEYFSKADTDDLSRTVVKELIHALTFDYMKDYVDSKGKYKVDNPPKEIINLVVLFNETRKKLKDELDSYTGRPTNEREKSVVYGGTSIYEFVEVVLTEPNFQKEMASVPYKSTDKSLFDKFTEILNQLLTKILGKEFSDNVTSESIKNVLKIIDTQSQSVETSNPFKEMQESDTEAQNLLSDNIIIKKENEKKIKDISNFTLHSGGAVGADSVWQTIGSDFGLLNSNHYYYKDKTPKGNAPITEEDFKEGIQKANLAAKAMYGFKHSFKDNKVGGLLSRNWQQVKNSDSIFAISKIVPKGGKPFGDSRIAEKEMVAGGTGYAVEMAIQAGKPVYVFDQDKSQWFTWSGDKFIPISTPKLTYNFAGIGTRNINESGKQAIKDVYENTINNILLEPTDSSNFDSFLETLEKKNC